MYEPTGPPRTGALIAHAVRSDGSNLVQLKGSNTARRINFASGAMVQTDDAAAKKSTTMAEQPLNAAAWHRDPQTSCVDRMDGRPWTSQPVSVSQETVAGYRTAKIVVKNDTRWLALDYGCALVKSITDLGARGRSETVLVSLTPGEPAAALFAVPDNFQEGPPSALTPRPSDDVCGPDCKAAQQAAFDKMDQAYWAHRPPR